MSNKHEDPEALKTMLRERRHPVIKRIRKQLIFEVVASTLQKGKK